MFLDPEDMSNLVRDVSGKMPDGLVDATSFVDIFAIISESLLEIDCSDEQNRMVWMINVINCLNQENIETLTFSSVEAISALCFHVLTLFSACNQYDEDFHEKYSFILKNNVISDMKDNNSLMPYWD